MGGLPQYATDVCGLSLPHRAHRSLGLSKGGWLRVGGTSIKKVENNFSIIYEVVKKPLS